MHNTIAFTLCSNNYLSFAKTLGDSYMAHHPKSRFIIGIVDKPDESINYEFFQPLELVFVDEIESLDIGRMSEIYNIIEFNTAVKPFYYDYLFKKYTEVESVLYFDPDIKCYGTLREFSNTMKDYSIGLTPHITTPVDINSSYELENRFLNFGLYNLGFLWLNRSEIGFQFLEWWMERLDENCKADLINGIFVDQLWVNFVPIFYKDETYISYDLGMNMAHWNFHERKLSEENGKWMVNQKFPLKFYHFSGIKIELPEKISKRKTLSFKDRPDVHALFLNYRNDVIDNKYHELTMASYQYQHENPQVKPSLKNKVGTSIYHFRNGINSLFKSY